MDHILSSRVRVDSFEGKPCTGALAKNQGMIGLFTSEEKAQIRELYEKKYKKQIDAIIKEKL